METNTTKLKQLFYSFPPIFLQKDVKNEWVLKALSIYKPDLRELTGKGSLLITALKNCSDFIIKHLLNEPRYKTFINENKQAVARALAKNSQITLERFKEMVNLDDPEFLKTPSMKKTLCFVFKKAFTGKNPLKEVTTLAAKVPPFFKSLIEDLENQVFPIFLTTQSTLRVFLSKQPLITPNAKRFYKILSTLRSSIPLFTILAPL